MDTPAINAATTSRTTAPSTGALPRRGWSALITSILVFSAAALLTTSPQGNATSSGIRNTIKNRAQIAVFDDFRSGLDRWQSSAKIGSAWSYDQTGFALPGNLSLLTPSMGLTDYDFDTVVQIESAGLGLAFRAAGPDTYQAVKLIIEDPSDHMPSIVVERYAVIKGKESARAVDFSPLRLPKDTLYRVHLHVRGDSFTLYVQDHLIAFWSDARLRSGGVGFFCNKSERARIGWVRVSQNADMTGKVCAILAPLV